MIASQPNLQNWAAITLTLVDGDSFAGTGRCLITATGYTENTAMGWKNDQKATVGNDWGKSPSLIEGIPATITLPVAAGRVHAWSLDERGQRAQSVPVHNNNGLAVLYLGPQYRTLWYEVEIR